MECFDKKYQNNICPPLIKLLFSMKKKSGNEGTETKEKKDTENGKKL